MADNSKLVAILSYITIVGWIIALILHLQKKTKLGGFHLRQTLILNLAYVVIGWVWFPVFSWILSLILFVFWIIGLIGAIQGEEKEIPLIGPLAQDWFKGL